MVDVGPSHDAVRDPSDRQDPATAGELVEEGEARPDLGDGRRPVGVGPTGQMRMGRDDVPKEHVRDEAKLGEHASDNGCRGLARGSACQLALGGERDAAHARAPVARRFPDEEDRGAAALVQVVDEPTAAHRCALALAVEVERRSDPRSREVAHEMLAPHGGA